MYESPLAPGGYGTETGRYCYFRIFAGIALRGVWRADVERDADLGLRFEFEIIGLLETARHLPLAHRLSSELS